MRRNLLNLLVPAGSVIGLLAMFQCSGSACALVDQAKLAGYHGGEEYYCVYPFADSPNSCFWCRSDGNGHYVKCDSSGTAYLISPWDPNQSPTIRVVLDNMPCGGSSNTYTDPQCQVFRGGDGACGRIYKSLTSASPVSGVNCDL